jgi:hypothetical protein
MKKFNKLTLLLMLCIAIVVSSCSKSDEASTQVVLKNYSVNPSLVKALPGFESLEVYPLISSDDKLEQSPNFIYGAQPDGAGIIKDPAGKGYIMVTNHEILRAASRVYLDETFKPVKGEYIVDGDGGLWRLCSATMATQEEHGFGPLFLTAGESGVESMVHAVNPFSPADPKNTSRVKPALSKANWENAVPLPKDAYAGKTVIILGEDDSNGQVVLYVANTVGDLDNGKAYFLKRTNNDPVETNMAVGTTYDVEFVEITDAKTQTGAQIVAQSVAKNAVQFARVEDLDYRKGGGANGREIYFVATGISSDRVNPVPGKTMWGRLYRLVLDANDPLKGKLEPLIDGGIDPGNNLVNPDNVCTTNNFVYVQEDGDSFYTATKHDGRIWQYNIATKALKPMLEMNHRRNEATFNAKYNTTNTTLLSSWEYGAMVDISDLIGVPNTFIVNIHPHTWRDLKYSNADGSSVTKTTDITSATGSFAEGGQTVIVRGVEK